MSGVDGAVLAAAQALDAVDSVSATFQPVVELSSGAVFGYEALARWPDRGDAAPAEVFALAKVRGTVGRIDFACRAAALRDARRVEYARPVRLFLNIEPGCLVDESDIDRHLDAIGTDFDVVLEITERDLDGNVPLLMSLVRAARRRKLTVALDDVGANPATLDLLPLVAPDIVKLDASIVQRAAGSRNVMRHVHAYLQNCDAALLAEGIETEAHRRHAVSLGATLGQGWLFGRPSSLPSASAPVLGLPLR